jgi:DHA2 family methylenomycin A resistance protein-like MFS transporter
VTRIAPSARRRAPFDWFGQVSAVVAMGALTYGAIEAGASGFTAPSVVGSFVLAAVSAVAFVMAEGRVRHPMVPLALFRSRNVSASLAVGFAFVFGYFGLPFVMSLYLQQVRGLSALGAGLAFVPMMVSGAVLVPFSARLAERLTPRIVISAGLGVMGAGLAIVGCAPASTPVWALAALMVVVGVAGPLVIPPMTAVLLNSVPGHQAGTASGVFNTSRQLGGALAIAIFGALLSAQESLMPGLRLSLLLAAGIAIAAGAVSLLLRPASSTTQKGQSNVRHD